MDETILQRMPVFYRYVQGVSHAIYNPTKKNRTNTILQYIYYIYSLLLHFLTAPILLFKLFANCIAACRYLGSVSMARNWLTKRNAFS